MVSKNKKKKIVWQQYIAIAFMMLIGAICGVVMVSYFDMFTLETTLLEVILSITGLFFGMYAALFFHMIVHEAGHLLFGLMTGYKFSSFRIASFMWLNENGKIKFKRLSLSGTGGQCLMIPPDMKNGKFPFVLYNLGGSFINVILGILLLIGYFQFKNVPFVSYLFLIFAIVGIMVAMMNGIPMRMGAVDNDGYNAFALLKNKEAAEAFWVQLKINEQCTKGVRSKDMPSEWFAIPTDEAMKNSMVAARAVFACNRLMDEEKFKEADTLIEHILEIESGIVGLHHDLLMCDRIYMELIEENRSEVIECMLNKEQKKFMKTMKHYPSVLRTQYAIALIFEQNTEKAETIRQKFENIAKTYPYSQDIEAERNLMKIVDDKIVMQG